MHVSHVFEVLKSCDCKPFLHSSILRHSIKTRAFEMHHQDAGAQASPAWRAGGRINKSSYRRCAYLRTRSSGPALRWSLFWMVCLISCFSSWGMSPRCAMSRMRVRGVLAVYASVNDGSLRHHGRRACRQSVPSSELKSKPSSQAVWLHAPVAACSREMCPLLHVSFTGRDIAQCRRVC